MQRIQQQVQAQLRQQQQQQQAGQRQSQQAQMLNSGSFGSLPQSISQVQQTSQFANQQWMDPSQQQLLAGSQTNSQRNSFNGMNSSQAALMLQQQQQGAQNSIGMGGSNSSLYWNAMQGNQKGASSGMDPSGSNSASLGALGNMGMGGNSSQLTGMMDSQMQALLQQQSMGNGQASQMRSMGSQQNLSGGKNDLSSAMNMMTQQQQMQHQMSQLQKMQSGSSSALLGRPDSQMQQNSGSTSAQLLLQQQSMIADLKRRLQAQQSGGAGGSYNSLSGNGNMATSSNLIGTGMNDHRSNASSIQQQQAQLLEMQQRGSANSAMLQQAMASGMLQDSSLRGSGSSASMMQAANAVTNQQQQRNSFSNAEPISISALMGQGQNSMDIGQMGRTGNNNSASLLGMFDQTSGNSSNASMLMQQQAQLQQMASNRGIVGLGAMGGSSSRSNSVNEQLLAQQQQLLNASGMGSMGTDMQQAQQLLMGQTSARNSMVGVSGNQGLSSTGIMTGFNEPSMGSLGGNMVSDLGDGSSFDKSLSSSSGSTKRRRISASRSKKPGEESSSDPTPAAGQSFLDGTFNGGWQSNDDIPDRRRVIYSICKVIEQMRPDASKMSQRLPFMAKRLEEHLYRSAQTKEEYLDPSTLKKRLQMIAHGLEVHRSTSSGSTKESSKDNDPDPEEPLPVSGQSDSSGGMSPGFPGGSDSSSQQQRLEEQVKQLKQIQQLQQLQQQQQQQQRGGSSANLDTIMNQQQSIKEELLRQQSERLSAGSSGQNMSAPSTDLNALLRQQQQSIPKISGPNKPSNQGILKTSNSKYQDPQKRKVVKQQQQRLLLLRHASKCKAGSACKVKFCGQMVSLWKHMKKCRDKNCTTAHCLSSRCVLNHYRICKSENETSTCEVCGPVMRQIKQQNNEPDEGESIAPDRNASLSQNTVSHQQALEQQAQFMQGSNNPNLSSVPQVAVQDKRQQLEELQAAQQKLHQQHALLKQLQNQQAQLLEQQQQLQQQQQHVLPQTQQGQQLQQQQLLLQQLQQQFQQQQMLLQHELLRQSPALQGAQNLLGNQVVQGQNVQALMAMEGPQIVQESVSFPQNALSESLGLETIDVDPSIVGKDKRRVSATRRASGKTKSFERQLSSSSFGSKGSSPKVVRRTSIGKRLSALESTIFHSTGHESRTGAIGPSDSFDTDKSLKSSAVEMISFDNPSGTSVYHDENAETIASVVPEELPVMENRERVLEQGDADHTTSLIASMSKRAIEEHLHSLEHNIKLSPRAISQKFLPLLRRLLDDQFGWVFRDSVDPDVLGLHDYFDVVKNPMHLSLVEQKLENGVYKEIKSVERDIRLVFENAVLYNGEDSEVGEMAISMLHLFEKEMKGLLSGIKSTHERLVDNGDICTLCNTQRRLFEPTSLYCSGACGMQKIRRNSYYYTAGPKSNTNHWCVNCYSLLKDDEPLMLDDGAEVHKSDLQKLKNDSMPEEAWVKCDNCDSWVHQICALFNGRKNKSSASYSCPKCHLAKLDLGEVRQPDEPMKTAKDLPHCKMSLAIEKGLERHLRKEYESRAQGQGVSVKHVEKVEGLIVRVISNIQKTHVVRDEMYRRYSKSGCPSEFPVRSKCIALFQTINGVDVILFAMYVFEYDHDCPAPNRRRVYISYLDSVQYMEPACYRTATYHALLVEYLRYVKDRGFHTAHIWSCPPTPGDDYVFHCHPSKQLIPRDVMLRSWYHEMLEKAKKEGVVLEVRTLHDEYFKNNGSESTTGQASEPTCLPYFEGDYIPGEIENIIKEIAAEDEAKNKNRDDLPSLSTSNKGGSKKGTRSNPGELVNVGQDKVMLRLGLAMTNMQQNFMVVYLRSRAFAAAVEKGEDVSGWTENDDDPPSAKRMRIGGKNSGMIFPQMQVPKQLSTGKPTESVTDAFDESAMSNSAVETENVETAFERSATSVESKPTESHGDDPPPSSDRVELGGVGVNLKESSDLSEFVTNEELKQRNKRAYEDMEPAIAAFAAANVNTNLIGNTKDEDEPQETEMFESRQQILNYCQANHFQFDELRRAKHTTMMILFQLHHPNAPKFIPQCGACNGEIAHGTRYHCNDCINYDLCQDCYDDFITGSMADLETTDRHNSKHTFIPVDAEAELDVQKNREERSRSIKVHLELLAHAASCDGPPACTLNNCPRMKDLFEHVRTCKIAPKKNCKICSRILTLLTVHARSCNIRDGSCPLPYCYRIRETMQRRRQQQQLMDDRRRQAQNQLYRESKPE